MKSVGIDVSSTSFHACVYSASGKQDVHRFALRGDWLSEFVRWCEARGVDAETDWIVVENTGVYSAQICYPLHEAGFQIALLSPTQIRDGFRLRKTDAVDAARLAEYGYRFADCLKRWHPRSERVEQIHQRLIERMHYRDMLQELSNVLRSLRQHPVHSEASLSRLQQMIAQLAQQVKQVEEEIRALVAEDEHLQEGCAIVRSVPGCGEVVSWHILDVTDGFRRAVSGRQLSSHLGKAPHERSSGKSVCKGSHSRGYGPTELRRVLHMVALAAVRLRGELQGYYRRKVQEGKRGLVVLNAVKNKVLHRVCACLRDWRYYEREYVRGVAV